MASASEMLPNGAAVDSQGPKGGWLRGVLWKGERRGHISGNNEEILRSRGQNGTRELSGQFSALPQSCWLTFGRSFRYAPHFFHLWTGSNDAAAERFDVFS